MTRFPSVGPHLRVAAEGDRLVTHYFECTLPGYRGWRWAVTVTRGPRSKHITICETVLLPGEEALLAPSWVPWHERLQPGDLGVGDLLPTRADDDRLAPGYVLSDDAGVEEVSWELGLGRSRRRGGRDLGRGLGAALPGWTGRCLRVRLQRRPAHGSARDRLDVPGRGPRVA